MSLVTRKNISKSEAIRKFRNRVLQQSDDIAEFGGIQWELFGLMVLAWLIVYFALWKGITEARKVINRNNSLVEF